MSPLQSIINQDLHKLFFSKKKIALTYAKSNEISKGCNTDIKRCYYCKTHSCLDCMISGVAPQIQRVLKIVPQQQQVVLPGPGVRAATPASIEAKNVQGNRVLLQPVRTSSGATLYRNASGQLVQLVPLSQLRNLKPNFVLKDQSECGV